MKHLGIKLTLFFMTASLSFSIYGHVASRKPVEPCFECYAAQFREKVIAKDVAALKSLIGNASLSSDASISQLVPLRGGAKIKRPKMHDFFFKNSTFVYVEAREIKSEQKWTAVVSFVDGRLEKNFSGNFSSLVPYSDYYSCEVVWSKGRYFMPEHLCFFETDLLEPVKN